MWNRIFKCIPICDISILDYFNFKKLFILLPCTIRVFKYMVKITYKPPMKWLSADCIFISKTINLTKCEIRSLLQCNTWYVSLGIFWKRREPPKNRFDLRHCQIQYKNRKFRSRRKLNRLFIRSTINSTRDMLQVG